MINFFEKQRYLLNCINHYKTIRNSKSVVEEEQKYKRECKGRAIAISRRNYRLHNSDVYYVESESSNNTYYFVKFKPDVL